MRGGMGKGGMRVCMRGHEARGPSDAGGGPPVTEGGGWPGEGGRAGVGAAALQSTHPPCTIQDWMTLRLCSGWRSRQTSSRRRLRLRICGGSGR